MCFSFYLNAISSNLLLDFLNLPEGAIPNGSIKLKLKLKCVVHVRVFGLFYTQRPTEQVNILHKGPSGILPEVYLL